MAIDSRLHLRLKQLRGEMQRLKTKKFERLDRGDQLFVTQKLEQLIDQVLRLQIIAEARCTDVVEMYEYMGGYVPTHQDC